MARTSMSLINPALVGTLSHRKKLKSAKREPLPLTDPSYTVCGISGRRLSRECLDLRYKKRLILWREENLQILPYVCRF